MNGRVSRVRGAGDVIQRSTRWHVRIAGVQIEAEEFQTPT